MVVLPGLLSIAIGSGGAPLVDVRIGEFNNIARIELECGDRCDAELFGADGFLVTNAFASFDTPLDPHSKHLQRLKVVPHRSGIAMTVDSDTPPRAVTATRCGPRTLCFDFDFSDAGEATLTNKPLDPSLFALSADLERLTAQAGVAPTRYSGTVTPIRRERSVRRTLR